MVIDNNETALATLDLGFGDDNVVVKPTLQMNPSLKWMTGNLTTTDRRTAIGWHIPSDVNPALDEVLAAMGTERYIVRHKTGDVREVPYWWLNWGGRPCSLIIVAYGVKSSYEMMKSVDDRVGVAYGLGIATELDGSVKYKSDGTPKKRPQLQFRAFIHELLNKEEPDAGFNDWFQVSLSNYMVDYMFGAFREQFRVLDAFNAIMQSRKNPNRAQFWGFSLPTVPREEPEEVGQKEVGQSSVYPIVARVPQLRTDTAAAVAETLAYLNAHRIPMHIQNALKEGGLLDDTLVWSIERSIEIVQGKQDQLLKPVVY